jgi:wyosine [tRNA(Phe)-imidazoG37] synthetase (radical SAM superfamily)
MDSKKRNDTCYTYGPVPSRRLGLSLGVDIVTPKVCTLDCVYCQLGRTTRKSSVRQDFVDIGAVLREIKQKVDRGLQADYITIGGSGEPTLNARLGDLIDGIRAITPIPVAILTNGTLLYRADVRMDCAKADVVMPTLDAGDRAVFEAVNRPTRDITIEKLVSGLRAFRREFRGQIWLEVFFVAGVNTGPAQVEKIKNLIEQIQPDKVHLNTAVRPPAEPDVRAVPRDIMLDIARRLGVTCEVIGDAPAGPSERHDEHAEAEVVSVLKRRPCSIEDLSTGLRMDPTEVAEYVARLEAEGVVTAEQRGSITYFHIRSDSSR